MIEGCFKFPLVAAVLSYQMTKKDQSQVRAFFLFPPPSQATLTFYLPAVLPRLPSHDNILYCKQSVFPSPRCSIMAYKELR